MKALIPFIFSDGADFEHQTATVVFPASETPSVVCVNITIIDDFIAQEEVESFLVSFELPDGMEPGPNMLSRVDILDNDGKKQNL